MFEQLRNENWHFDIESNADQYLIFTDRVSYLNWVQEWKETYRQLTINQRRARLNHRQAQSEYSKALPEPVVEYFGGKPYRYYPKHMQHLLPSHKSVWDCYTEVYQNRLYAVRLLKLRELGKTRSREMKLSELTIQNRA